MQIIHIVNPVAGKGRAGKLVSAKEDDIVYTAKGKNDITEYVRTQLNTREEPITFYVYGGDGTINEAVNGILTSDYSERAVIHPVAAGSGNDFLKTISGLKGEMLSDVIEYNGKYCLNMINIGFDCNVVDRMYKFKNIPLMPGSAAYILGVADLLFQPLGEPFKIEVECDDGRIKRFDDGDYLLCSAANGCWCGGGFNTSPLSVIDDGVMEISVVKKVSRGTFVAMVGDYKKGRHINPDDGKPCDNYKPYVSYLRAKRMTITGLRLICADGEVSDCTSADIRILPHRIRVEH